MLLLLLLLLLITLPCDHFGVVNCCLSWRLVWTEGRQSVWESPFQLYKNTLRSYWGRRVFLICVNISNIFAFLMFLHFCSTGSCLACPNDSGWALMEAGVQIFLKILFAFSQLKLSLTVLGIENIKLFSRLIGECFNSIKINQDLNHIFGKTPISGIRIAAKF